VTTPGSADSEALALAQRLAALPADAIASTKRFFEPYATLDGERLDRLASRHFARNCEGGAAQAIFAKFR
jgi:enoyl-CoA hydratase/carnithine racemase